MEKLEKKEEIKMYEKERLRMMYHHLEYVEIVENVILMICILAGILTAVILKLVNWIQNETIMQLILSIIVYAFVTTYLLWKLSISFIIAKRARLRKKRAVKRNNEYKKTKTKRNNGTDKSDRVGEAS